MEDQGYRSMTSSSTTDREPTSGGFPTPVQESCIDSTSTVCAGVQEHSFVEFLLRRKCTYGAACARFEAVYDRRPDGPVHESREGHMRKSLVLPSMQTHSELALLSNRNDSTSDKSHEDTQVMFDFRECPVEETCSSI